MEAASLCLDTFDCAFEFTPQGGAQGQMSFQGGDAFDHGGMPAVEPTPDIGKGKVGMLPGQEEGGIARQNELALTGFGTELFRRKMIDVADVIHDIVNGYRPGFEIVVAQNLPGQIHGDVAMEQLGLERQILQAAFELADIGGQAVGQQRGHGIRKQNLMNGGLVFEDALAGGQIGLVDNGQEAGTEA